jgi:hypothetical protein
VGLIRGIHNSAQQYPKLNPGSSVEIHLYKPAAFMPCCVIMLKKFLAVLPILLLTGCAGTFSRLTPLEQPRNSNNLYPVEAVFNSSQQSLRWDSIQANVLVDGVLYPMRQVPMMQNRWDGFVPVPPGTNSVSYRFKFDYLCNAFGQPPKPDSSVSPVYKLTVIDQ